MLAAVVGELEERLELVGSPDPIGPAPVPSLFGGVGGFGRVVALESAADGVIERGPDDDVDVEDGLGGESLSGAGVAVVQQVGVELFETFGAQPP